jgi:hypothetical protein
MAPKTGDDSRGENRPNVSGYGPSRDNYRNPDRRPFRAMQGEDTDQGLDEKQQRWDNYRDPQQRQEEDHYLNFCDSSAHTDSHSEGFDSFGYVAPQGRGNERTNGYKGKGSEVRVNVCYEKFHSGKCNIADCTYSHKDVDLRAHGAREMRMHEKTMRSPYVITSNPMNSRGGSLSNSSGGPSSLSTFLEKKLWFSDVDTPTADIRDTQSRTTIDDIPPPTPNNPM